MGTELRNLLFGFSWPGKSRRTLAFDSRLSRDGEKFSGLRHGDAIHLAMGIEKSALGLVVLAGGFFRLPAVARSLQCGHYFPNEIRIIQDLDCL
jgi:hypothetical protein